MDYRVVIIFFSLTKKNQFFLEALILVTTSSDYYHPLRALTHTYTHTHACTHAVNSTFVKVLKTGPPFNLPPVPSLPLHSLSKRTGRSAYLTKKLE